MPNWCVNQLHVSGSDADDIMSFMTEPKPLLHRQATRAAVKLFLAGVGGLLKPTKPMTFDLYPSLIQGVSEATPQNEAFTQFVGMLSPDTTLDNETCQRLIELYEQSGLKQRYWGDLPKTARAAMAPLLKESAFDWCPAFLRRLPFDVAWAKLDIPNDASCVRRFSLNALLPPKLLVELNGFNGCLFTRAAQVPSAFTDNCDRLGTKWEMVDIDELDDNVLEFDTAWSPALPPIAELARRYPNSTITHYFCECGCAFCGYKRYENGVEVEECWDDLQFSEEENEEGYHELIGPDYALEHFSRFGG